ncbi:flagella basal body P-ring formation protein FlgA [Gemmobacter lutimaris]|uniref:Flagella basal body P-ring formation protein FlgA n=1 Tax=Gemmobacter lutimaris TaxID=2306023 RepID=A0A398BKK8_9RHOB|nr:flagellar basal body P-ring formation chaperone FlgA [Gemmobacter lutimaris]RID90952.1 flagella basal body P-ring formation protein FlgA [Gemmobacter lutimaris]
MRWLFLALAPLPALADTLVTTRTIRAQEVLTEADVALVPGGMGFDDPLQVIGMEARVAIYANRPIRPADIGPPALIDRNQVVTVGFSSGPLRILTEGRALERAGLGEPVRVMNLASRTTVTGRVRADGIVIVGPQP